jgi:hypothetical protein
MKQTAVDWLYVRMFEKKGIISKEEYDQAKEMEKEQISDAYVVGYADADNGFYFNDDYYNETFNNKEK